MTATPTPVATTGCVTLTSTKHHAPAKGMPTEFGAFIGELLYLATLLTNGPDSLKNQKAIVVNYVFIDDDDDNMQQYQQCVLLL